MLSEIEESVAQIFDNKDMEEDSFCCFLIALRKKNGCKEMLEWLNKNKHADVDSIRVKVWEIYDRTREE